MPIRFIRIDALSSGKEESLLTMAKPSIFTTPQEDKEGQRLERNVLRVPHGIALAAAAMAPAIAVVLNAPAAGPSAGAALPLSF